MRAPAPGETATATVTVDVADGLMRNDRIDGLGLNDRDLPNLVDAMAGFDAPPAGQYTLPADLQTALEGVIAANWH